MLSVSTKKDFFKIQMLTLENGSAAIGKTQNFGTELCSFYIGNAHYHHPPLSPNCLDE